MTLGSIERICCEREREREKRYLSDVGGGVFLSVDLGADGAAPPPALHHGVHGRRDLIVTGVGPRARLLQTQLLLDLLLQRERARERERERAREREGRKKKDGETENKVNKGREVRMFLL